MRKITGAKSPYCTSECNIQPKFETYDDHKLGNVNGFGNKLEKCIL